MHAGLDDSHRPDLMLSHTHVGLKNQGCSTPGLTVKRYAF